MKLNQLIGLTALTVIVLPLWALADQTTDLVSRPKPYFGETTALNLQQTPPVHINDIESKPAVAPMDNPTKKNKAYKAPAKKTAMSSSSKPDPTGRREAAFRLTAGLLLGGLAVCLAGAFCSSPFTGVLAMGALGALIMRFFA
ncbi:hypothetical protein ACFL6Y_09980 [Elusimicrobiota bacterium]